MATKVKSGTGPTTKESASSPLDLLYGDFAPYTLTLTIKGVMPFLFNRNDEYVEEEPGEQKRPRKAPTSFEDHVWRNDAGELALPTANVIASIAHAGRYFGSPIAQRGSAKTTLQEAMVPAQELASFGVKEWDAIDFRVARYAGKSRAPKPTWRARLEKGWELGTTISVITPELYSPSRMAQIITHAGRVCGVGDGRKLGFGRFVTVDLETTEGITW